MRRGAHIPKPDRISVAQATTQLKLLLVNARPERLAEFTPEGLARMYRVPTREIECMLLAARAAAERAA